LFFPEATYSSSNAKVESYFRTLKKGTACGQKRLRPRELLCKELERVLGCLNERKLPVKPDKQLNSKRDTKNLQDEEECWKKNKKPRKYSNAAVRQQVLRGRRKFHKRKTAGDENQS
jgi:hypothetical protein